MTNEQLYILLHGILSELRIAIKTSRVAISDTREPQISKQLVHDHENCTRFLCMPELNSDHWHEKESKVPDVVEELEPLDILLYNLELRFAVLKLKDTED